MAYRLSPTTLNLYNDCTRCFWLQFNKDLKRPSGVFPSLPSGMDAILKKHFDNFMEKGELPPELRELAGVKLFDDKKLLSLWRNNRKGLEYADSEGNVLHGALDNLLVNGEKLIVLDYKTRGFPCKEDTHEHYVQQMDIYNFLLRKNGFNTEDYTYLLFYYPLEVRSNGDVVFEKKLIKVNTSVERAEKLFSSAVKLLNGEIPPAAESCEYCRWREKI